MGIISISLNDTMMKELDHVQKTLGFTGRSEIVRTGIRNFLQEEKEKLDIKGKKNLAYTDADESRWLEFMRSKIATDELTKAGFDAVNLDGGYMAWKQA